MIPKAMREALGLKQGARVLVEQRGPDEIVIRAPESPEAFLARFFDVPGNKLERTLDLKRLYDEQYEERHRA